jgi:CheY-like chemotaxis protein
LGLSIVFGITQHSGGNVTVYSEPGHGTTFTVYLPRLAESAGVSGEPVPDKSVPRGSETILLVEDEDRVRALVEKRLRELGYRVLVATDGVDALAVQLRHQGPIQLVISDVVMPRMGGPELVRRLISLMPDLRVLFVSGYTAEALSPAELHGVQPGFLQKPFSADALAFKVREVLDRSRRDDALT